MCDDIYLCIYICVMFLSQEHLQEVPGCSGDRIHVGHGQSRRFYQQVTTFECKFMFLLNVVVVVVMFLVNLST